MKKKLLTLNNLSIGFENKTILKDISANLFEASLISVMGENGIGKTCLLHTVAGLIPVKSGELIILDKNINQWIPIDLAKVIAVVLTDKIRIEFMKVYELISLGRSPYLNRSGSLMKKDHDVIWEVIELMNITALKDLFFNDLSDGQKQKVMIARALAQDPSILILDEPTTHLDVPSRNELMNLLRKIANEKKMGILLSSHDTILAAEFSDGIWHINNQGMLIPELPSNARKIFF